MNSFQVEHASFYRHVRLFGLEDSLIDLWRYSLHIAENQTLPEEYLIDRPETYTQPLTDYVYPWELDILARELLLHARTCNFKSLRKWKDFSDCFNYLRRLDEAATSTIEVSFADVMAELHRIVHRQFPWQKNKGVENIIRTFKIYGAPEVDTIVQRELGMSTRQFLLLGMTLGGQFLRSPKNSVTVNYAALGIPLPAQIAFFDRITTTASLLRAELAARPIEPRDWTYGWNPLETRPLVIVNPFKPELAQCPIPRHLLRRMSSGLYYDLVGTPGFENPFGRSFQDYVGDVISATCSAQKFRVRKEMPYKVGLRKKDGVDWILSDHTGHMFIETKTKRMTLDARTRLNTNALVRDIDIFADAIVQLYKNITMRSMDGQHGSLTSCRFTQS